MKMVSQVYKFMCNDGVEDWKVYIDEQNGYATFVSNDIVFTFELEGDELLDELVASKLGCEVEEVCIWDEACYNLLF